MRLLLLFGFVIATIPTIAAAGPPPPGATARCRDGTYSFATHRQGACSHHGGVGVWLAGSGGSEENRLGKTVLLAPRTKTSGCRLGANPDRRCSPGAYYSKLTKHSVCSAGFVTTNIRNVSESKIAIVMREYGMTRSRYGRNLEIDHIVPLELGGSNDIANLFPEGAYAHPGYAAKDRLENRLHDRVCSGSVELRTARLRIAADWQSLSEDVFGVAP